MHRLSHHRRASRLLAAALCGVALLAGRSLPAQEIAVRTAMERGVAAMRAGKGAQAEADFRQAVRLAPTLPDAELDLGLVLAREGKLAEATDALRKAIALNARMPSAHMFLGVFLFQLNQAEEARKEISAELSLDPNNTEALMWLGNVDLAMGHPERAAASFDKASELAPDDLNLLELRGQAHSQVAHDSYARMAKLDPNSWHVHRVQAQLFADEGKHADAAKEYKAALQQQPGNPDLYERLGDEYRAESQLDAAQAAYARELELAPGNPVAQYNLGSVQVERGETAPGVALLRSMNQAYPGSPVAEYYLGRGLASAGQDEDALTWLQRSAQADTNGEIGKRSYYELARLYRKLRRNADAQTATAQYNRIREQQEKQSSQQVEDWKKLTPPVQADASAPSASSAQ